MHHGRKTNGGHAAHIYQPEGLLMVYHMHLKHVYAYHTSVDTFVVSKLSCEVQRSSQQVTGS